LLQAGDVYELAVRGEFLGTTHLNILHFSLIDAHTAAQAQSRAQVAADAWKEVWRGNQHQSFNWIDWRFQQVAGAGITYSATTCRRSGGDVYSGALSGTLTGAAVTTEPLASTQAVVAALRTGRVGRSYNGRTFVGGWAEGTVVGNSITSVTLGSLQTALSSYLATYGVLGTDLHFSWQVFSRLIASGCKYVNALPRPVLTHVQAGDQVNCVKSVQSATVESLLAPMHRRKAGVGG